MTKLFVSFNLLFLANPIIEKAIRVVRMREMRDRSAFLNGAFFHAFSKILLSFNSVFG